MDAREVADLVASHAALARQVESLAIVCVVGFAVLAIALFWLAARLRDAETRIESFVLKTSKQQADDLGGRIEAISDEVRRLAEVSAPPPYPRLH